MTSNWPSFETVGPVPPRKPPPDPSAVTNRKELADAIWEAMRGLQTQLGSASRRDRVEQILAACDAYAAVQITAAITPTPRRNP